MTGRLTLSWANKDKALLSNGEFGYEWVERDDPRVREVRLLDEIGSVGEVSTSSNREDNLLIRGDSADALRALVRTPEYASQYRGKVKLVYIDPPFNTGQAFEHYDDSLEHSVWLGMMRERLVLIRELLAPDGSVWVHLDDAEMAYCRVLMDEIFGRANFVATVVWERKSGRANDAVISSSHDTVLVAARSADHFKGMRNHLLQDGIPAGYSNPDGDPRGPWVQGDFTARDLRPNLEYPITAPDGTVVVPPPGRHWRTGRETFEQLRAEGRIHFRSTGMPRQKVFLSESRGLVPNTWWPMGEVGSSDMASRESTAMFGRAGMFSTPKPERLLERVIHIGSNPGDIILDCFAGSGTTAAVAHKMGRRWVTVELSEATTDTFTKPRLEKVVAGEDPGGITSSVGWTSGGGFRDLKVAASVWEVISDQLGTAVFQAEGVTDDRLARAVAAQLGYELDGPDDATAIFVGRKGRSRLAVAPGVVDAVAVGDIVSALGEGETVVIAALSSTEDAASVLKELSPGSRILRMPTQLFPRASRVVS